MNRAQILKAAKKNQRRGLSVRDFNYWDLEEMVKEGVLNKSFPKHGRGAGWPCYKISRRGFVSLRKYYKQSHGNSTSRQR
jgi:hypothetical protein